MSRANHNFQNMTIREHFTAAALTGLTTNLRDYMTNMPLSENNVLAVHLLFAKTAVEIADLTLAELEKGKT